MDRLTRGELCWLWILNNDSTGDAIIAGKLESIIATLSHPQRPLSESEIIQLALEYRNSQG